MAITPIFLLSPPRSGSTLLQRILAAHDEIATTSEPWLLLPLLSPLRSDIPGDSHRDALVAEALADFRADLPGGDGDFREAAREMALRLYADAGGREDGYFVDKTPLYHLIVDEIAATFPEAKLIFLFRNPLAVVASAVELWGDGRWDVHRYTMALFQSVDDLTAATERYAGRSTRIRYEDLITDPAAAERLMSGLGLTLQPQQLSEFAAVELHGRMGDPVGTVAYRELSQEPLTKWRATIDNPVRKAWCRRYLRWIGSERLAAMGYDLDALLADLDAAPDRPGRARRDAVDLGVAFAREVARRRIPPHSGSPSVWHALLR